MRGFFAIGIEHPKKNWNVGTLWRSAYAFDASFIFTIGHRYTRQASDTLCTWRHIPLMHFDSFAQFQDSRPHDCELVGIEYMTSADVLHRFSHPQRCVYLLGAEDHGLSQQAIRACQRIVRIPATYCLNVATAGSIVMYDRSAKAERLFAKAEGGVTHDAEMGA
jgi:tRNA (guanosine-2'-O-)-methyltransferase